MRVVPELISLASSWRPSGGVYAHCARFSGCYCDSTFFRADFKHLHRRGLWEGQSRLRSYCECLLGCEFRSGVTCIYTLYAPCIIAGRQIVECPPKVVPCIAGSAHASFAGCRVGIRECEIFSGIGVAEIIVVRKSLYGCLRVIAFTPFHCYGITIYRGVQICGRLGCRVSLLSGFVSCKYGQASVACEAVISACTVSAYQQVVDAIA